MTPDSRKSGIHQNAHGKETFAPREKLNHPLNRLAPDMLWPDRQTFEALFLFAFFSGGGGEEEFRLKFYQT